MAEDDIIEEDIGEEEQKANKGIVNAFTYFLGQDHLDKAFTSILQDYAPRSIAQKDKKGAPLLDKTGNQLYITKKAKGFSFKTFTSFVRLAFAKPVSTYNLLKFVTNQKKYNTSIFQNTVLQDDRTWDFVQKTADHFEDVSTVMKGFGVKEFQKDGLLNQEALASLKSTIQNPVIIASLRSVAIESRGSNPDYLKITSELFSIMEESKDFSSYLKKRGSDIQAYISGSIQDRIANDSNDRNEWNSLESRKQKLRFLKERGYDKNARAEMLANGFPESTEQKLANYGLAPSDLNQLLDIVPTLLGNPSNLKTITDQLAAGEYISMTKTIVALADSDTRVQEYLHNNKEIFGKVFETMLENNPIFSDLKGNIIDIIPTLFDHPKELLKIIELQQAGRYTDIGEIFLEMAKDDPNIRTYFSENKGIFKKAAIESAGLETYGLGDEIVDILDHLTNDTNLPKIQELAQLASEEKWMDLGKDLLLMIEEDPKLQGYFQDNEKNFKKLVKLLLDKSPQYRKYFGNAKLGAIVNNMLQDPKGIRELLEGVEGGAAKASYAAAKFVAGKLFDAEFRGAALSAAQGYLSGKSRDHQGAVAAILEAISERQDQNGMINLSEFVKEGFESISENMDAKKTIDKQIDRKKFFEGAEIKGTIYQRIKLENLEINGNQFVNTKFSNLSFKGSNFTNAAFHGATFDAVEFSGSSMDGVTLESILDEARKNNIKLDGVKIVGNLQVSSLGTNWQDLSALDLRGIDLSDVTSVEGVDFSRGDLSDAIMPEDMTIFASAYGLETAKFPAGVITKEILQANQEMISNKISEQVIFKAANSRDAMSAEAQKAFKTKITQLYNDQSKLGTQIRAIINNSPESLVKLQFPVDSSNHKHVLDYKSKSTHLLSSIYKNRDDPSKLEQTLVAGIIADEVTAKLFGTGKNRGQDALIIREKIAEAAGIYAEQNEISSLNILNALEFDSMVEVISNDIRSKTKYTKTGMISSGIYLPENAIDNEIINKITRQMNKHSGPYELNKQESALIAGMADKVAKNLFDTGVEGNRKDDANIIHEMMVHAFYDIKQENKLSNISALLSKESKALSGALDRGYFSDSKSGLTELFYDSAKYTKAGTLSGGIELKQDEVQTQEFQRSIKELIKEIAPDSIKEAKLSQGAKDIAKEQSLEKHVATNSQQNIPPPNKRKQRNEPSAGR